MSYNIDSTETITCDAWIHRDNLIRLRDESPGKMPECCFLRSLDPETADQQGRVKLTRFEWRGEGSGWAHRNHLGKVAQNIRGHVEAILFWEGGDSVTGLRIVDGKLTEPKVTMTLAPEGSE